MEAVHEVMNLLYAAPFHRTISEEEGLRHTNVMRERWHAFGSRFEAILEANGKSFLVGDALTYVDILMGHCLTWFVEEVFYNPIE